VKSTVFRDSFAFGEAKDVDAPRVVVVRLQRNNG